MRDPLEGGSCAGCCLHPANRSRVLADERQPHVAVARRGAAHGVGAQAPANRAAPARQTTSWGGLFACPDPDGRSRLVEAAVSKTAGGSSILPARAEHNFIETGLHGHRTRESAERPRSVVAPGSPSQGRGDHHPTQTRQGVGANSTVNSIRQAPDPSGSGGLPAAAPRSETTGTPAPRQRVGWATGGPPGRNPGPLRGACRFEPCPAHHASQALR